MGLLIPSLFVLTGFVVLVLLGTWQLQRKDWKEGLIATLQERLTAEPIALPARAKWASVTDEQWEFRRVRLEGVFAHAQEAHVYAVPSALRRGPTGEIGYFVFTPIETVEGGLVAVNRGHVPEARRAPETRKPGQIEGRVTLTGIMRWPEPESLFTPAPNAGKNLFFLRDQRQIATIKKWGDVAPFYIELESPAASGGGPEPAKLTPNLRNPHLQYALTWYGLGFVLLILFGFWLRSRGSSASP